jgi:cobalt-zinc-cadmium efflux system protein
MPHEHRPLAAADADQGKLLLTLALIVGFMCVEVIAGILASSLALLSDAAHMLTDAAAIGLAVFALGLAERPAGGRYTFGLGRAEILSAQFNGATLLVLGLLIVYEGVHRLVTPPDVEGAAVLAVAVAGAMVNLVAASTLAGANRERLNVEGAFQHVVTDLAAFIATAIAGAIILTTGFREADGIAALVVAAIMLRSAWSLLRDSGRVFLEAAPKGIDPDEIGRSLASQDGVVEVHDLHVWEVTSGFPSISAHVVVTREADCHQIRRDLEALLHERFELDHSTLQVDHQGSDLLQISPQPES